MDIKHRKVWVSAKLYGVREPVVFEESSVLVAMQRVLREIAHTARAGECVITIDVKPIESAGKVEPTFEDQLREMLGDRLVTDDSPEAVEMDKRDAYIRLNAPWSKESQAYDALMHEYHECSVKSYRERKTPEDLHRLRTHVESRYRGTEWWKGFHAW